MNGAITLDDALEEQINIKNEIAKFSTFTRPKKQNKKNEREITLIGLYKRLEGRQMPINSFEKGIFL